MAAGPVPTLPDGAAFPPGHFKDPKRLYCKNGGFFLRIRPDGRVDGVREKSDPHGECAAGHAGTFSRSRPRNGARDSGETEGSFWVPRPAL